LINLNKCFFRLSRKKNKEFEQ
jgi:hypothetical protein